MKTLYRITKKLTNTSFRREGHFSTQAVGGRIKDGVPTENKITNAICFLKNGKSPEPDHLRAEIFKCDPKLSAAGLQPIINKIWKSETIPADWKEDSIVKIPKKSDLTECENWNRIFFFTTNVRGVTSQKNAKTFSVNLLRQRTNLDEITYIYETSTNASYVCFREKKTETRTFCAAVGLFCATALILAPLFIGGKWRCYGFSLF